MRKSLYEYCFEQDRPELLAQWDEAAELPETPQTVSYGSKYRAHWRCGCPMCAGKVKTRDRARYQRLTAEGMYARPKRNIASGCDPPPGHGSPGLRKTGTGPP